MFHSLFGGSDDSPMAQALMWKWATAHPFLFTLIKITEPYLFLGLLGVHLINMAFRYRRGRERR